MRISSKGDYGLRALFDLAQRYGEGPVQSEEIANRQGIPVNYLNQLLITMRRAGLIESLRGPQGGHMLARRPDAITLLDAITVMEGPLLPAEPSREDLMPTQPDDYAMIDTIWQELRGRIEEILGETTLDDLCQRKRQQSGDVMYYI
ncbi:MAG: Rrf2 family transcriptional regulator [Chloroflexales bacterium]|jgi:Rrf2 family transcriptional regulator, cysteine metabolism repressor